MVLIKLALVNKFQTGDFYMCPGRNSDSNPNKRITVGIILIFLGRLFLLNTLDLFNFEITRVISKLNKSSVLSKNNPPRNISIIPTVIFT
jgi:hypothetical protein